MNMTMNEMPDSLRANNLHRYRLIYLCFDISFLIYLIAYMAYFEDKPFYGYIRVVATCLILATGVLCWFVKSGKIGTYSVWYIAFLLFGLSSFLWAMEQGNVTLVMPSMVRILFLSIFLTARISMEEDIEILFRVFIGAVIIFSLIVIQKMIAYFSASTFYLYRLGLNIGYNPNAIAIYSVFSCIILIHYVQRESNRWYAIDAIMLMFLFAVIVLTGSKKGILGLLFGLFTLKYFKLNGIKRIQHIIGSIIFMIIIWQLIMNIPAIYSLIGHRIDVAITALSDLNAADVSTQNRFALIREAISVWFSHPVLGVGLNNFSVYQDIGGAGYYAHCNYVELLADLGLIGFILYYSLPTVIFSRLLRKKGNSLASLFLAIIATILLLDIAMVSYNDFIIQIILCIANIGTTSNIVTCLTRTKYKVYGGKYERNYSRRRSRYKIISAYYGNE